MTTEQTPQDTKTPRTDPLQILPLAEHPECRSAAMEIFSYSLPEEEHIFLAKIPEELPPLNAFRRMGDTVRIPEFPS